ncbi:MAG: hypothetical protein R3E87_18095 [Burkholderiaceae bacterium]
MRPPPERIIDRVAELLADTASLDEPYARAQLLRAPMLLRVGANEIARAHAWQAEEVDALHDLLSSALALVDDAALCARLRGVLADDDGDQSVVALQDRLDRRRAMLIELHAWCEQSVIAGAPALLERIWQELLCSTQRRRTDLDRF